MSDTVYQTNVEDCLYDLGIINTLYNKEILTLEEFMTIRNRILDKMIELSKNEKG